MVARPPEARAEMAAGDRDRRDQLLPQLVRQLLELASPAHVNPRVRLSVEQRRGTIGTHRSTRRSMVAEDQPVHDLIGPPPRCNYPMSGARLCHRPVAEGLGQA